MYEFVLLAALLIGFIVATYQDLRIREVPDLLTHGLITLGLLGSLIAALVLNNIWIFVEHLLGFALGAVVGLLMYYGRQWGGGDAKLIMATGAILGISRTNLSIPLFLVLLILVGAAYGLVWTLGLAIVHRKQFMPALKKRIREPVVHRARVLLVFVGMCIVITLFFVQFSVQLMLGLALLCLYLLVYSWIIVRTVEETVLLKEYPINKLTEGDWVAQDVKVGSKFVVRKKNTGITNEQIAALKRTKLKHVLVREGIPFVPSFLLALVALLLLQHTIGEAALLALLP